MNQHRPNPLKRYLGLPMVLGLMGVLLIGCQTESDSETIQSKPELIIYSGVTTLKPIKKLADEFSAQHQVNVTIKPSASGYMYNTAKKEHNGDLYFPGSDSYRIKHLAEGVLKDYVFVGYNRLALVVKKDNPKHLTNDIRQLMDPKLSVVLAAPDAGAVGKSAKRVLDRAGITDAVYQNLTYFTTDSRRIFNALKDHDADVSLNYYATTQWAETEDYIEGIALPEGMDDRQRLEISLLSYSKHPDLAKAFMNFASNAHGLEVFAHYGFLTPTELAEAIQKLSPPTQNHEMNP